MPMSFFGVFHTVEPNSLLIQTFEFSLAPHEAGWGRWEVGQCLGVLRVD